jgi:TAT (twin-arginine translocation) pathway signal sequence
MFMAESKKVITRRDFLKAGTAAAVGGLVGLPLLGKARASADEKSRVILIRDKNVVDSAGKIRPDVVEKMLDQAVTTLMDAPDPISAWTKVVKPEDVVGIKSNAWYPLRTPEALEVAIQKRLLGIGVKEENMAVDDRGIFLAVSSGGRQDPAQHPCDADAPVPWCGTPQLQPGICLDLWRPDREH